MYKYFFLLFLTCCTSNQPPQKISFVPKRNTVAKFYCSLENSSKISIEVNNKKVENNKKVMINYFYDFTVDTLGNRIINITFEKFFVNIKNNDDEEDYSSEKEDESSIMMDKVLKLIKGSSIQIEIDSKGKITKVLGAEDISTKVIKSLPDYQDNSNDIIKKQISEFIGQNFIKENLVNNFQLIPDSAICNWYNMETKNG